MQSKYVHIANGKSIGGNYGDDMTINNLSMKMDLILFELRLRYLKNNRYV